MKNTSKKCAKKEWKGNEKRSIKREQKDKCFFSIIDIFAESLMKLDIF